MDRAIELAIYGLGWLVIVIALGRLNKRTNEISKPSTTPADSLKDAA